jgi:hypothetical protein
MSETSSEEFNKSFKSSSDGFSSDELIPKIKRRNCSKIKIREHASSEKIEGEDNSSILRDNDISPNFPIVLPGL